jgi:hypothetical protein
MTDYLPELYQQFERRYPSVKEAFDALGAAEHEAGPLGERERRLIKLGIAVGAESEGKGHLIDGRARLSSLCLLLSSCLHFQVRSYLEAAPIGRKLFVLGGSCFLLIRLLLVYWCGL